MINFILDRASLLAINIAIMATRSHFVWEQLKKARALQEEWNDD